MKYRFNMLNVKTHIQEDIFLDQWAKVNFKYTTE
jgi:hypothetical protein